MNLCALKAKSYVSKQIPLFVHENSVVRLCNFCSASMQIPSCVHANSVVRPANEWQRHTKQFAQQFPTISEQNWKILEQCPSLIFP